MSPSRVKLPASKVKAASAPTSAWRDYPLYVARLLYPGRSLAYLLEQVVKFARVFPDTAEFVPLIRERFVELLEGELFADRPGWKHIPGGHDFLGLAAEATAANADWRYHHDGCTAPQSVILYVLAIVHLDWEGRGESELVCIDGWWSDIRDYAIHCQNEDVLKVLRDLSLEVSNRVRWSGFWEPALTGIFLSAFLKVPSELEVVVEKNRVRLGPPPRDDCFLSRDFERLCELDYWQSRYRQGKRGWMTAPTKRKIRAEFERILSILDKAAAGDPSAGTGIT